jgi:D-arabinose 1-dehydrogenase-like Zn-dependent alcohol dehydrogenase
VRPGGRIVVLGNVDGASVEIRPAHLILKEISLIGTKSITRTEMSRLVGLVSSGVLQSDVGSSWPLDQAVEAHRCLGEVGITGRAVLSVA